ncbi:MAG: hypothetical protein WED07_03110 [Candidatus Freyarchaeum deiterrae]
MRGELLTTKIENEFIQSGEFDNQNALFFIKSAVEETSKLYGPVFTRMVAEYALQFEAEKLKEKPPENIQGVDDVYNYITVNFEKYPQGYNSLIYGIGKAESKLQGFTAAGAKRAAYRAMKAIIEISGLLNNAIGTTEDALEAVTKVCDIGKAAKMTIPMRYIREENNGLTMVVPNCLFKDACLAFINEGISRMVGGSECVNLIIPTAGMELITKKHFDYKLEEFDKPECRGMIFEI